MALSIVVKCHLGRSSEHWRLDSINSWQPPNRRHLHLLRHFRISISTLPRTLGAYFLLRFPRQVPTAKCTKKTPRKAAPARSPRLLHHRIANRWPCDSHMDQTRPWDRSCKPRPPGTIRVLVSVKLYQAFLPQIADRVLPGLNMKQEMSGSGRRQLKSPLPLP